MVFFCFTPQDYQPCRLRSYLCNNALVNYGPASQAISEYVPVRFQPQAKIIGDLRPLQDLNTGEFRAYLQDQMKLHSRPRAEQSLAGSSDALAIPDSDISVPDENIAAFAHRNGNLAEAVLRWQTAPRDLDLYVFLPYSYNGATISYQNRGRLDAEPWIQLDDDVITGFGPETITMRQAVIGLYRFAVKAHSDDAPLAGCGATVAVSILGDTPRVFECPREGSGRWWHVFDYDFRVKQFIEVNVIKDTQPGS